MTPVPRAFSRLLWIVTAVAVAVAAVSLMWPARVGDDGTASGAVRRFTIDLGDLTLPRGLGPVLDISRDGEMFVFVAQQIWCPYQSTLAPLS